MSATPPYTTTATRSTSRPSCSASAISPVGNGRNETAISSSRLSRIIVASTTSSPENRRLCASQTLPIVRKLVTYAR